MIAEIIPVSSTSTSINDTYIHIPYGTHSGISLPSLSTIPSIEDLSCNSITIRQEPLCVGSVRLITTPPNAQIFIYDEDQRMYILQNVVTGSVDNPTIIDNIPCTSSVRSNKFRLTLPGYTDIDGILHIIQDYVCTLDVTMKQIAPAPSQMKGLLIATLAFGAFMFFLSKKEIR